MTPRGVFARRAKHICRFNGFSRKKARQASLERLPGLFVSLPGLGNAAQHLFDPAGFVMAMIAQDQARPFLANRIIFADLIDQRVDILLAGGRADRDACDGHAFVGIIDREERCGRITQGFDIKAAVDVPHIAVDAEDRAAAMAALRIKGAIDSVAGFVGGMMFAGVPTLSKRERGHGRSSERREQAISLDAIADSLVILN